MNSDKGANRALIGATACLLGILGLYRGIQDGGVSAPYLVGYGLSYIATGLLASYLVFGWTRRTRRYIPASLVAIAALHVIAMIIGMTRSGVPPEADMGGDPPIATDSSRPLVPSGQEGDTIRDFVRRRLANLDNMGSSRSRRYVDVNLPHGVVIELPDDWVVFADSVRVALEEYVQSSLAKRRMSGVDSDLAFAANLYDSEGETTGIVNVQYYAMPVGQRFLEVLDDDLLASIGNDMEAEFRRNLPAERRVLEWVKTDRVTVNGLFALLAQYRRASPNRPPFRVRILRVFDEGRSFSLTVSYREDYAAELEEVTDRVLATVRRIDNQ